MDYEQKYKEAFERARNIHKYSSDLAEIKRMEYIFPELAESEDEKKKKRIIQAIKIREKEMNEEWSDEIAWLEKQGQQKEYTFKSIPRLLDMIEPNDRAKAYCQKLIDTLAKEGYNTDVKIVDEVLKGWNGEDVPMAVMDEQKVPVLDFKAKDWYVSKVDGKIHNIYHSVNKIQPKFKVGDWIVYREGIWKIGNIALENYYELLKTNNEVATRSIKEVDENAHLWTIQDAKDGDVLADDYGIYIFDRFDEHDERCFLCMGAYQYSQKVFKNEHMLCSVEVYPATKEQRDLLFQKMHKAGYNFDFEKKELKKIVLI